MEEVNRDIGEINYWRALRCGIDLAHPSPAVRKAIDYGHRHVKDYEKISGEAYARRPDDDLYSFVLGDYSSFLPVVTGPCSLGPLYPGMLDMARFMRPLSKKKAAGYTPWPARSHLFLMNDFAETLDYMRGQGETPMPAMSSAPMDFRPLQTPEGRSSMVGCRIVHDAAGMHIMSIHEALDEHNRWAAGDALQRLGGDVLDDERYPLLTAVMTSISKIDGLPRHSWFMSQHARTGETGYGRSRSAAQNTMYGPEEREVLNMVDSFLDTLFKANLELLYLPNYFTLRVEAVEDLDAVGVVRAAGGNDADLDAAAMRRERTPSAFQMVKSLIRPMSYETRNSIGSGRTRAEPETQVEVSGFWRTLKQETSIGKGPDGRPVAGQTWVRPHVRYADKPENDKPKVKEAVAPFLGLRRVV